MLLLDIRAKKVAFLHDKSVFTLVGIIKNNVFSASRKVKNGEAIMDFIAQLILLIFKKMVPKILGSH